MDKSGLEQFAIRNPQSAITVMIAAGGTGGHIYPGLAIAKEFLHRDPKTRVVFAGTSRGLEEQLVPAAGFELETLRIGALKNVSLGRQLKSLARMPKDFLEVFALLRKYQPRVVIGAGGFVTGPVVLAAALKGLPTMVIEPNALPGFTNRILARFVRRAAVSFVESLRFFRGRGVVTGTPVRSEFFELEPKPASSETRVLVFGGSQGAKAINDAMIEALPHLESVLDRLKIVHQTGQSDYQRIRDAYERAGVVANVKPYIDRMGEAFRDADFVICRAGAMTSAEVAAAGRPAIMIPFPLAADDHQRKNAEALERAGAARMIVQSELSGARLAAEILDLCASSSKRAEMGKAARMLARPDAARKVVDLAMEMITVPAGIRQA